MKYRLIFALAALAASCLSCYKGNVALFGATDPVGHMNDSTVVLVGYEPDGSVGGVCSGVYVSTVEVVTAAHCLSLAMGVEEDDETIGHPIAYFNRSAVGGKDLDDARPTGRAIVVAHDFDSDLALLSVGQMHDHGVAWINDDPILQGQRVWAMGHVFGLPFSLTDGTIGADRIVSRRGQKVHVLQVVSGSNFGSSGGGVFSEDGGLLGIASFRIVDSSLTFFVHRDTLVEFLKREGVL